MTKEKKPIVLSYCTTFLKSEMHHVYRQVTGLRRYETVVFTRTRKNHEQFPASSVVEIPPVRNNFILRFYRKYIRRQEPFIYRGEYHHLLRFINREPTDLMHVYFGHTGVHLLPFLKRWKKPKLVSFHGADLMHPRDPKYGQNLKELFRTISLVLARSESLKRKLMELGCAKEKIRLNRTGIPMKSFPKVERTPPANGEWQLAQACRFIEKKGIEDSLRAFSKFRQEFPRARFHLIGDGPLAKSLEEIAQHLNLGCSIQFHGFCSQANLYDLLAQSHIFLHPSRITLTQDQEGIPNAMLEAMATGLPIVATRHGGIPEAVTHGKNGLLGEEGDWNALAQHLRELAVAPHRWATLGASAATSVREKFDQSKQIENLERLYDEAQSLNTMAN